MRFSEFGRCILVIAFENTNEHIDIRETRLHANVGNSMRFGKQQMLSCFNSSYMQIIDKGHSDTLLEVFDEIVIF